jgi:hypothetical protein
MKALLEALGRNNGAGALQFLTIHECEAAAFPDRASGWRQKT